jgi:hypothetical protein
MPTLGDEQPYQRTEVIAAFHNIVSDIKWDDKRKSFPDLKERFQQFPDWIVSQCETLHPNQFTKACIGDEQLYQRTEVIAAFHNIVSDIKWDDKRKSFPDLKERFQQFPDWIVSQCETLHPNQFTKACIQLRSQDERSLFARQAMVMTVTELSTINKENLDEIVVRAHTGYYDMLDVELDGPCVGGHCRSSYSLLNYSQCRYFSDILTTQPLSTTVFHRLVIPLLFRNAWEEAMS